MNHATYIAVSIFQSGAVHYYHTVAELEKYLAVETYQPRDAYTTIKGKQFRVTWWHGKLNFQPTSGFRDLLDLGNGLFVAIENANSEPKPARPLTSEESQRARNARGLNQYSDGGKHRTIFHTLNGDLVVIDGPNGEIAIEENGAK